MATSRSTTATLGDKATLLQILMIMGLGAQRVGWPPEFLAVGRPGSIRDHALDNRDAGLLDAPATKAVALDELVGALMGGGQLAEVPYTLSDMAVGGGGVGRLGHDRAHIVSVDGGHDRPDARDRSHRSGRSA